MANIDVAEWAEKWCSPDVPTSLVWGRTLSPCWSESLAVPLLALSFIVLTLVQRQRFACATERRALSKCSRGFRGGEAMSVIGMGALAAIHAVHLVITLVYLRDLWFHVAFHACAVLLWVTTTWTAVRLAKVHVALDMRPVHGLAVAIYGGGLYTYIVLYGASVAAFPPQYLRSVIWSMILQVVIASGLLVLDFCRQKHLATCAVPPSVAAANGYTALPDVEVGAAVAGEADSKLSWLALFIEACVYVWPDRPALQLRTLGCVGLLVIMRFLNLAVPILYKHVVDTLASAEHKGGGKIPPYRDIVLPYVALYLCAVFFQGGAGLGMGFINNLRSYLWIPVYQDAFRRISIRVFDHVMDLDLNFHLRKKTGEVTKLTDRGTNAMQNILSTVVFSIGPQLFDVLAAATYLAQALEPWVAVIVFVTVGSYIPVTIIITEWRSTLRRDVNRTEQAMSARATDALLNYETVKYFTNEQYETGRYEGAIKEYQAADYRASASINLLNVVQSVIMFLGIAGGLLVCANGVREGTLTVGDVVLFLALMAQLYAPLNYFGSYYRTIQQYMIDMENMFELLDKRAVVVDRPNAVALTNGATGAVEYADVSFEYEPKTYVLQNVSFTVQPGHTVGFVGATGSGKSTLARLLFRFYDVTGGAISIGGVDIRDIKQTSLRRAIGMVPQDTVLFNDTIMHNIRYGNTSASDEEVMAAADAACIHEAITTRFAKGYNTIVGERGLRLSGGEKQRVAFARAILKNPDILVLDEATSALDTITEKKIQSALLALREQRTTLIVAHRLSTIADANMIVVMRDGRVAEQGHHQDLLNVPNGLYAELWNKQLSQITQHDASGSRTPVGSSLDLVALGSQHHA